ncbi:hypothetical protein GCM10007989_02060 [Devosia pacifica]|uniref:Uncharacterized protein n=1 Tax=Devosia pacifica TaxID=1335967 RepID=A0A918RU93_9HYPH|nr:hypothetical protein [Devosia pacifica]GHA11344.1 hypothetical protein GCM10007989_02060 [Devosia pacifica]
MANHEAADQIRRVLNNELYDVERYMRSGDIDRAKRELEDANDKLKRIMNQLLRE